MLIECHVVELTANQIPRFSCPIMSEVEFKNVYVINYFNCYLCV